MEELVINIVVWACSLITFSYGLRMIERLDFWQSIRKLWAAVCVLWWVSVAVISGWALMRPFFAGYGVWEYPFPLAVFVIGSALFCVSEFNQIAKGAKV